MAKRSIVPFGPQHPVLPEPVHLDLVLEDETVVGAIPSIGFVHRGLEKLVEKRDYKQYVYIAERVCGICSCGHGLGYCESVEQVMGIEVPDRARYLRTIWMEMSTFCWLPPERLPTSCWMDGALMLMASLNSLLVR